MFSVMYWSLTLWDVPFANTSTYYTTIYTSSSYLFVHISYAVIYHAGTVGPFLKDFPN